MGSTLNYIIDVVLLMIIIIAGLVIIKINYGDTQDPINKKIKKIVTIETLDDGNKTLDVMADDFVNESPCNNIKYSSSEKHDYCGEQFNTKKSCTSNSCCVWLNGNECVGGSKHGPTYYGNKEEPLNIDYYHHKNKKYKNDPLP